MSVISNSILAGSSGQSSGAAVYPIKRSLRFNSADSSSLTRTPSSAGNRRTFTISTWIKTSEHASNYFISNAASGATSAFSVLHQSGAFTVLDSSITGLHFETAAKYRDPSAWYHLVVVVDTTQGSASDRVKIYVNGELATFSTAVYPNQNAETTYNDARIHYFGGYYSNISSFNGYLAETHSIDGQALAASDFGKYDSNSVWQPKEYTGTYGTNGFYLDYDDNSSVSALGTDTSGNNNNFTVNNISVTAGLDNDSLRDSPVNGDPDDDTGVGGEIRGNYAILSSVHTSGLSNIRLSEGGLKFFSYTGSYEGVVATIAMTQKTYWETKVPASLTYFVPGIIRIDTMPVSSGSARLGISATEYPNSAAIWPDAQAVYYNGSSVYSTGAIWSVGDVIGHAYDPATGNYYGWRNGTALNSGNPVATLDTSYTYAPAIVTAQSSIGNAATINFGQGPFTYGNAGTNRADASYKCLCTSNIVDPTIEDGSKYFDIATDTGANILAAATGKTDNAGFTWIKDRATNATNHILFNRVNDSGMDGTPHLRSNTGDNETTCGTYSAPAGNSVGWVWGAGSSNTTIAAGGLNSSVYNQDQEWSGYTKTGPQASGAEWAKAFNGDLVNGVYSTTDNTTTLTIDVADRPTWSSSIRIYGVDYGGTPTINGTDVSSAITGTLGWFDLTSLLGSSGTLASFSLQNPGGNYAKINAVELDGKLLVDTSVSVNNVPSIASTVSANPSAGFSVVSYTGNATSGATVGHGLNAEVEFIICKNRDTAVNWVVYHKALGATKAAILNTDAAPLTTTNWANTAPTSSVFSVGGNSNENGSSNDQLAYCFAPVEGYSAFGSFAGNSNADGPFAYCGFRPRWVMLRANTADWYIFDTARGYNGGITSLFANTNWSEQAYDVNQSIDIYSNGFKIRGTSAAINSGSPIFFAAFAEHPFKTSRAR